MDDIRNRFLRDRVMTATPTQRVVLLYDRLILDLARAQDGEDATAAAPHLQHAALILSELVGSLDHNVGGPASGLASIYQYGLRQVLSAQLDGFTPALETFAANIASLRDAWRAIAEGETGPEVAARTIAPVAELAPAGSFSLTA